MEEKRNYIDMSIARGVSFEGKEPSPEELATHFAKTDMAGRVDILDWIDRDLASNDGLSLNEAVKLNRYVGALRNTHNTLRKVGR